VQAGIALFRPAFHIIGDPNIDHDTRFGFRVVDHAGMEFCVVKPFGIEPAISSKVVIAAFILSTRDRRLNT
jgi:hypothetical protein